MRRLKCSVFMFLFLIIDVGHAFNIIGINKQMLYEYVGNVLVGSKPQDEGRPAPPTTGWIVRGKLTLQRQNELFMAAALVIDDVTLNNSGEKFLQNKEMYPPYKPFKIVLTKEGSISHVVFKEGDPIWSMNFKRAIASTLQFQIKSSGAFVVDETGIHGRCQTEYFVSNKTNGYISIRKTPELMTCVPYSEAVHVTRSNVPPNTCEFDHQKSVIIGNEAIYGLMPHNETGYFLSMAHAKGTTLIHTFESTGEAQYINSELVLNFQNESLIDNPIDIETSMAAETSHLQLQPLEISDPTGGRNPQQQESLIAAAGELLDNLAEALESTDFKFSEPYDSTLSDVIKLLSEMDLSSLKKLYTEVDIGTSYRQETIRNIFHEIIPRIGTKASVLLTRYLVMEKVKSPIAVQLLIPMPFHIFELSAELVKECEVFLNIGPDRPDVKQAAVLSFATLVYNVYMARGIDKDQFEAYVQKYLYWYLNERSYEQKMLFLQGLSNLQVDNVASYLEPIVMEEGNEDLRFMAAWTTLALADKRAERIYEIYWPIFESRNASLELRVAAVTLLLISNPTAARLISIHRIIQTESDPHLINYYRTTVTSISETTYPCYQHLRRLLSYMHRHLPQKPEPRYWVTGNYIFDYRDSKFGIGAMLQTFLVGDPKSDMPVVFYFKFDTEALGKFTGQLALYIKARGLPDAIWQNMQSKSNGSDPFTLKSLKTLLAMLKAPMVASKNLHIEFILQMEGKAVLSYYLNQRMFQQLTYDNILDRLQLLIRTDSHINMQTVRWPFMNKYSVPTVLGTSSDVLLQTTVLTSLRGNITEHRTPPGTKHTLEIDARYSSYASVRSRSYNPFLNLDHEINREQGFLIYIPFSSELTLNESGRCAHYSFHRPQNLTSGLSFKSRAVTTTRGLVTKTAAAPYEEIMYPERGNEVFQPFSYALPDLGVKLKVNINLNELIKFRGMLLKSEFIENGFSRNMILSLMMYVFGFTQLSSIHLGHDRNFTMLMYNENATRIDGNICAEDVLKTSELKGKQISFTLEHTDETQNVESQHKWNVIVDIQTSTKSNWFKVTGKVQRNSKDDEEDWKACSRLTYEPLVFTKRPHTLNGYVVFGLAADNGECPERGSKVQFAARAGPSEHARAFLRSDKLSLTDTNFCPKEVLKFSPIPTSKYCKRSNFENFTSITQYDMDLKFDNMPAWFDLWSTRLDHLVSALSAEKVDSLHMSQQINITMHTPHEHFWLTVEVNGVHWRIYHIPFLYKLDSKFDTSHELAFDSGLKRSCSVINGMVNSFDDYLINLGEIVTQPNCLTLLAADCSSAPKMAVFLTPSSDTQGLASNYGLRVHIGQNYFNFHSRPGNSSQPDEDPVFIYLNQAQTPHDVRHKPYQWPIDDSDYVFRVELNEQNILIVECTKLSATIQFDMYNILNFEIYGVYKHQMCGLCSKPLNRMENYTLCDLDSTATTTTTTTASPPSTTASTPDATPTATTRTTTTTEVVPA